MHCFALLLLSRTRSTSSGEAALKAQVTSNTRCPAGDARNPLRLRGGLRSGSLNQRDLGQQLSVLQLRLIPIVIHNILVLGGIVSMFNQAESRSFSNRWRIERNGLVARFCPFMSAALRMGLLQRLPPARPGTLHAPADQPAAPPRSPPPPLPARCNGCLRRCSTPAPWARLQRTALSPDSALVQSNHVPGDDNGQATLSNGQIFIQKADGKFQYFIQAGAYTLPSLATPFLAADKTVSNFYGPVPVAFAKVPGRKDHPIPDSAHCPR